MATIASVLSVAALSGCGSTDANVSAPLTLDRPVDIGFACYGSLRLTSDSTETISPMPTTACDQYSLLPKVPPTGQEDLTGNVDWFGFVLQSVPGTVALINFPTRNSALVDATGVDAALTDADPLTPGRNSVAVGELPIAIATDRAGCQMVTANAGTCDLSILDVKSFVDGDETTPPQVKAQAITNATGQPVLAKPAAMIAEPPDATQPIGDACPADPEGLVYVAYPGCHLVAAIRAGTGVIEHAIRFNADGTVDLTDGNVSCPAECGDGPGTETPGARPVTIDLVHDTRVDTRRLVIGADNSPTLTVVELDATYAPVSQLPVTLEGNIGVTDVAMSPQIGMGGSGGVLDDSGTAGGQHQFVYAVASDASVRVADVTGTYTECDTQVDPRYLRGVTDVGLLGCLPVGDPATPPRRATARGPGIETATGAVPLSVAIAASDPLDKDGNPANLAPAPDNLVGYFAFVTTTQGDTFVVNIDDDGYIDFWRSNDPLGSEVPLAIAHQTRDANTNVDSVAEDPNNSAIECDDTQAAGGSGPRLDAAGITQVPDPNVVDSAKQYSLPSIRRLDCTDQRTNARQPISELAFAAPVDQRELDYPDWRATRSAETWTLTWEGSLSRDDGAHAIDGPANREGVVTPDGNAITISDPSHPFCNMGTEVKDFAVLAGCDPAQGDAQCGLDETCYVHPDSTVATGSCLPKGQADALSSTCRDYLITMRHFAINQASSGELRLVPRRHVLDTTPPEGCTDDNQCKDLAAYQEYLGTSDNYQDFVPTTTKTYACEADPTRGTGVDQCVETCQADTDCDDGTVCSNGTCIEGVIPAPQCVPGVQRYQVRASEAFTVIGSLSGYLHPVIEDPGTGACVIDPNASPLNVGRIPLSAPACPGPDDFTSIAPNPCSETIDHFERVPDYPNYSQQNCDIGDANGTFLPRQAPSIRFKNAAMTFHLVDPVYPEDKQCREDALLRNLTRPLVSTAHQGYQIAIPITAGFLTQRLPTTAIFPIKVKHGPSSSIWVVDEGDFVPEQSGDLSTRGQLFRVEATSIGTVNTVQ